MVISNWRFWAAATIALALSPDVGADTDSLAALRWNARPLILFAPRADDPAALDLKARVAAEQAGFRDRRMVLVEVYPERAAIDGRPLDVDEARSLADRLDAGTGEARMVLVGLDGGAKLRAPASESLGPLFELIDGMPMRRQELRERGAD